MLYEVITESYWRREKDRLTVAIKKAEQENKKEVVERKHAQKELLKSKTMLQSVFDGISEPLLLLDNNLTVKILNRAAIEYYGDNGRSAIDKPCYRVFKESSVITSYSIHYTKLYEGCRWGSRWAPIL